MQIPGDRKLNSELVFSLKSSLSPVQDKVNFRRERVLKFRKAGFTNIAISHKLRYCLSTIEKDIAALRIDSKQWGVLK